MSRSLHVLFLTITDMGTIYLHFTDKDLMIRGVDKLAKITELGGEWWEPELCPAHPSRLFSP